MLGNRTGLRVSFLLPSADNIPKGWTLRWPVRPEVWPGAALALQEARGTAAATDCRQGTPNCHKMRHLVVSRVFGPATDRTADGGLDFEPQSASDGRGQMAKRRMERDADMTAACALPVSNLPPVTIQNGATGAVRKTGAIRATPHTTFASQGAMRGSPACRSQRVGARRHGVILYGNKAYAGGCHPPGRNPHCRYQRQQA